MASDCIGAVQDGLVRDGHSGLTFRAGDAASLAERLSILFDPERSSYLRRIATIGQQEVGRYSFAEAARSFVDAATLAHDARQAMTPTTTG